MSAARLLSVAWGTPESRRRLAAITARAGETSRQETLEALSKFPHRRVPATAGAGAAALRMSHRTYQDRGYCTRAGYARLDEVLGQLCDLGNAALQDPGAPGRAGRTRPAERRGDPRWPSSA